MDHTITANGIEQRKSRKSEGRTELHLEDSEGIDRVGCDVVVNEVLDRCDDSTEKQSEALFILLQRPLPHLPLSSWNLFDTRLTESATPCRRLFGLSLRA